ncbi:hypothetical protein BXT86_00385 [candidate division WOR-3 bacterium 4484_100]|uniref:Histidine biosynthesis bifunctional protein HisIE n=1 Tax=candidate division WOR-3 bacterium 4484_100 TaxID=1936077 RepID=A0A1V4QGV7_UNCW3|nr:MAG: hypothetical protein BXT86_00385 [candidate division WOR-3 bacterium 4484_100]
MIVPSIDLMAGEAVQMRQGKEMVIKAGDPMAWVKRFDRYAEIALVDLDAAMGRCDNRRVIQRILRYTACRVGGGIRSVAQAREMIQLGASKVIIGSRVFKDDTIDYDFLERMVAHIGSGRIIIAVDALNGEILTNGWRHRTGLLINEIISTLEPYANEFLFTCVEREGLMKGTDLKMIKDISALTEKRITVAGGICSIEEIKMLCQQGMNVQLGMALYTERIDLTEAFISSLDWTKGLIPTVVQEISGPVLMLAYSNGDSIKKTFETNRMWYFSRSRKRLWMKGETSGNIQEFIRFRVDCDADTLLALVRQNGVACHLGTDTCFGNRRY